MPITIGGIVDALEALGGEAHYKDIARYILDHESGSFPQNPAQSVSARLQENSSDYQAYKGNADLFESDQGSGIWRFRNHSPRNNDRVREEPFSYAGMNDYEAYEGGLRLASHLSRERDATLIAKFKAQLAKPVCDVCKMDFSEAYGVAGANYIEAHHRIPVSKLAEGQKTTISDLVPLCANCHRIIHRNMDMAVEELAEIVAKPGRIGADIQEKRHERNSWREAVVAAIARQSAANRSPTFTRQQLVQTELERIVADVAAKGATPAQTLSRILQEIRDDGAIAFVSDGEYKILKLDQ